MKTFTKTGIIILSAVILAGIVCFTVTKAYSFPYCKITCGACGQKVTDHTHNGDGTITYNCWICGHKDIIPDPWAFKNSIEE